MTRLRHVSPDGAGLVRQRVGRGFRFIAPDGSPAAARDVARCQALVIPPAWRDVWICPDPRGHIQAVGTDARGRRQYLYHPTWREQRDLAKFDRILELSAHLPAARRIVRADLMQADLTRRRALGTAFRLLDLGYFRVGNDIYAEENGSFGLTTLRRAHVRHSANTLVFDFPAKSGKRQHIELTDALTARAVAEMTARRGSTRLLSYRDESGAWTSLSSTDVNTYLRELLHREASAKDFRTWHATVRAAIAFADVAADADTDTDAATTRSRNAHVATVMRQVAEYLGNTPTIARTSYVDPRLIDLFDQGRTIAPTLARLGSRSRETERARSAIERATRRLLKHK